MTSVLAKLESILDAPSKYDESERYAQMAEVIRQLAPDERRRVMVALHGWLRDEDHSSHATTSIALANVLPDHGLMKAAIDEGRRRGLRDEELLDTGAPRWLVFQSHLIGAITEASTEEGLEYLRDLADEASNATSRSRRRVAISAWIRLCFLEGGPREVECLREAFQLVRRWDDPLLSRAAEGSVIGLYVGLKSKLDVIRAALTPSELQRVLRFIP